jgi:O-antigen ligase
MIAAAASHDGTFAGGVTRTPGDHGEWLARMWVLALFSNIPVYVGIFVFPLVQPLHWIAALSALTLLMLARPASTSRDRVLGFPVAMSVYLALCLATYVAQGGGDPVVLRQRFLGVLVAVLSYFCFTASERALLAARRILVWVVLFSVAVNVYDITHPLTLVPADSEFATLGRAAGLFMNPNQAGAALILGFALSLGVVAPRWRVVYAVMVTGGVVLTLSRGALVGLALIYAVLMFEGKTLRRGQVTKVVALTAGAGYVFWLVFAAELLSRFSIDPSLVLDRILWILDPTGRADFSQEERVGLAERGWLQFVASPYFGNGLGSTELWELRTSTHNLYLMLASDFGIAGWFVLPLLLLAAVRRDVLSLTGGVAAAFLLFWALLSHNVLSEYYILLAMSLMAAVSASGSRSRDA